METITLNIYKVSELSGKAQTYVLDKYREVMTDYQWWDFIYEDAQRLGLEISAFDTYYKTISIEYTDDAEDTANKIIYEYGQGPHLYLLASKFLEEYTKLVTADEQDDDDIKYIQDEFLRELGEEFLSILDKEYEWRTSDEAITEYLEDNQYMFTANGTQIQ